MPRTPNMPPEVLRALTCVLRRSPLRGRLLRTVLRRMAEMDQPFDAARLAGLTPSTRMLASPDVSPILWPTMGEGPGKSGPLGGERVVVKDTFDVAGLPEGCGQHEPAEPSKDDALLVARVRAAGGHVVGKTLMTELGMDGLGVHQKHSTPHNPRARGHFPGGSSTGTAVAVADGSARFGLGGDGLGSIRIPSAFCGLVGLKPTHGLLPVDGYQQDAPTLDVPGPMARTAADCALLWQVMAGEQVRPLQPLRPGTLGLIDQLPPSNACPGGTGAFWEALDKLGSKTEPVSVPGAAGATTVAFMAGAYETSRSPWAAQAAEPVSRLVVAVGKNMDESDGAWLRDRRVALREALSSALERCDFIATPTTGMPAPPFTRNLLRGGVDLDLLRCVARYTTIANCTGFPAIAIPWGQDERGRPYSLQVYGRPNSETDLLRIALALVA